MRRLTVALLAASSVLLAACSSGEAAGPASDTVASSVSRSTPAPSSPTTVPPPVVEVTPEELFLAAMDEAAIVPEWANAPDAIRLATTICVAYGSGQSFTQVMATLAGGSLSLGQMMDLNQAATQHYCPRFYVPSS